MYNFAKHFRHPIYFYSLYLDNPRLLSNNITTDTCWRISSFRRALRRTADPPPVPDARHRGLWLRPPTADVIGGVGADWRPYAAAARAALPERHAAHGSAAGRAATAGEGGG